MHHIHISAIIGSGKTSFFSGDKLKVSTSSVVIGVWSEHLFFYTKLMKLSLSLFGILNAALLPEDQIPSTWSAEKDPEGELNLTLATHLHSQGFVYLCAERKLDLILYDID
jgi:hypothetical protein